MEATISFERGISTRKNEVHRSFAVFVGKSKSVAGGLFAGGFGGAARVDEISGYAAIHEQDALARNAFAIEGRAELQGMISVVGDGDILAEKLFAHAVIEAGALVFERRGREVVKKETDEIEDGGGFENHGVAAGCKFARHPRPSAPFRWRAELVSADRSRVRWRRLLLPNSRRDFPAW